jgi:hypothetical protein
MKAKNTQLTILGAIVLALVALSGSASSQVGEGGRPPMYTPLPATPGPAKTVEPQTPVPAHSIPQPQGSSPQLSPSHLMGMNLYLTGLERTDGQAYNLGRMASEAGVWFSREELSWANIEPNAKGQFAWALYDRRIDYNRQYGMEIIGMLLTTPRWASTNPGAPDWYWYEPARYEDYFDFVRAAVNRWKDRIHTWEIWNEPNHQGTWNCLNNCDRAARYAALLAGAYSTIKAEDPDARVLIGGLYIHDRANEGMAFLDRVVDASGGNINFDGLSIHTYMPDRIPESLEPRNLLQNYQYRLHIANDWINAHGGRPGEIWVTEDGRSTCTGCPFRWSEEEQANMLVRMYGISAASPRVVHFSYFQFEDKFNNPTQMYGGMSIVRDDLSVKPGYAAYATTARMLDGATYLGMGPQMIPAGNPHQPDSSDWAGFDYIFDRAGTRFHMLWRPNDAVEVDYPVETAQVDVVDRDGGTTRVAATNGYIRITIGPRPQYIVNVACAARFSDVCPDHWAYPFIECLAARNIISGYGDGTFRPNNEITRGQLAKVVSLAAGWTETRTSVTFQDVGTSNTFHQYVERSAARGVIGGYPCGGSSEPCVPPTNRPYFRPNAGATRGQITKVVSNAAGFSEPVSGQTFEDVPPSNPFYAWVQRLSSRGIMGGYACGGAGEPCGGENRPYFRPQNNTTRAQLSKIVANTFYPACSAR